MVNNFIIDEFLKNRKLTHNDLDYLLNPKKEHQHNPFLLNGVNNFIDELHKVKNKNIMIVPDYDADGISSGTLLNVSLYLFGFGSVFLYPPSVFDGYGLTRKSVDNVLKLNPKTEVIITTDNGSNAFEGVEYARSKGIKVLITDHHIAFNDPKANAVVNPNRQIKGKVEKYPFRSISGTTVIYKVLSAYMAKYIEDENIKRNFLSLIILVGIATISDVMPLLNENRYFVNRAVEMFKSFLKGHSMERVELHPDNPFGAYMRGLDLLVATLNREGKLKGKINHDTFGFVIGPMLNSPRRMIGESKIGFDLFNTTKSNYRDSSGRTPADVLFELNENRKAYVRGSSKELFDYIEENGDIISNTVFNACIGKGIAGLLSGNFTNKYDLPSICFSYPEDKKPKGCGNINILSDTDDFLITGSARSPEYFNLHGYLTHIDENYPGLIVGWGGHAQAAGISIMYSNFDKFSKIFSEGLLDLIPLIDGSDKIIIESEFFIDNGVELENLDFGNSLVVEKIDDDFNSAIEFFEKLNPYGNGFVKPSFSLLFNLEDVEPYFMGKDGVHVKIKLENGLSVIAWNSSDLFRSVSKDDLILVTGEVGINEFRGFKNLQLIAKGIQVL